MIADITPTLCKET